MEEAPVTINSPEKKRLAEVRGSVNYTGDPDGTPLFHFFPRPIHYAAANTHDNPKVVEHLMSLGANVNSQNEEGLMPLHIAASKHNRKIVEVLLEHGADVRLPADNKWETALHLAAFQDDGEVVERDSPEYEDSLSIVKSLLRRDCDIEALDRFHETPLMMAVKGRHLGILKELLTAGANVHARNEQNQTCLHILLAVPGKIDMMIELVRAGIFVEAHDNDRRTALSYILDRDGPNGEKMDEAKALIRISMLVYGAKKMIFFMDPDVDQELQKFKEECYLEIERMRSVSCGSTDLLHFAIGGTKDIEDGSDEIVFESVFNTIMNENYVIYADFIQGHFRRSYFLKILEEKCIYTRKDLTDIVFPPHLNREIYKFLSVNDLFNLLKVLFNSPPPEQ